MTFHVRNHFTGMVGVNLISLQIFTGIEFRHKSKIIGAFRPDKVYSRLKMAKLRNFPVHAQQQILSLAELLGSLIIEPEKNDMGNHVYLPADFEPKYVSYNAPLPSVNLFAHFLSLVRSRHRVTSPSMSMQRY